MMSSCRAFSALIVTLCILFLLTPLSVPARDSSSSSRPHYHRCSDGIWRRSSDTDINYVRSFVQNYDIQAIKEKPFSNPLYFSYCLKAFCDHPQYVALSERLIQAIPSGGPVQNSSVRDASDPVISTAICCFTGDIMCLRGQQLDASVGNTFDFWPSYRLVANIFKKAERVHDHI